MIITVFEMHFVEQLVFKVFESSFGAVGAWAFVILLLLFTGVKIGYKRYNNKPLGDLSTVTHYVILGIKDTVLFVLTLLVGILLIAGIVRFFD